MNDLHVAFIEDTGLHGGTQIWVAEAMRFLRSQGVQVTLLAPAGGWNAREAAREGDLRLITYDYDAVVHQAPPEQAIWTRALDGADVAVCTVHPPRKGFHCSVFAARCLRAAQLPTVLIPKTGTIVPEYERRFYLPDAEVRTAVIAITRFTRDYLVSTYQIPAEQVHLIYQGTDVQRFTPDPARHEQALTRYPAPPESRFILGNIGSFEERKGQLLLLEALAEARRSNPGLHLFLVGDGPDEERLRNAVAAAGMESAVSFFPFTREPELVFERLDALVLSSLRKEGLPNVLLEAMAMGVAVISTRLAGTPEVVSDEETGFLVEPGDRTALATAITRLAADSTARQRMATAGQRQIREKFDKQRQFHQFLNLFRHLRSGAADAATPG